LLQHQPESVYIDVDIPPLVSIAHWYLDEISNGRAVIGPEDPHLPRVDGARGRPGWSACLPSWRLPDLKPGTFDVFINCFSFQEMEPDTVRQYAGIVAEIAPQYVVSLNSRKGKPIASETRKVGVQQPTTSDMIRCTFEALGYRTSRVFGRPTAPPQAELIVLHRGTT
jgi:hypothetical protein